MIVWPGLRRSVSAIRRLFNSASFDAPLTHSAIPTRAATGTTATFTRATAKTWQNNDGYLVTGVAGEIGFVGARRVRNWIQAPTENWSSAGWVKSGISVSGNRLTATGANGIIYDNAALGMGIGMTAVGSVTLSRVTGTGNIDVSTNGGTTWTTVSVTGARVSVSLTGNINGQFAIRIVTSGDAVEATYPQLEDVTAQTTQTAGEYVSVGVESAPYYHGSCVDGVKCFATDINGAPIPSTTLLGYSAEGARTNLTIWNRDLTNAAWTRRSGTVTTALTAVGADGAANSATAVRNLGAPGVDDLYQTAAYAVTAGVRVEPSLSLRAVSTSGTLRFANAYDVGASGAWNIDLSLVSTTRMERITRNHPSVTITSEWVGGSLNFVQPIFDTTTGPLNFDVDLIQVELGSFASSPIATTTIAVARNADVLTYSSSGNISTANGWCYAETSTEWSASLTNARVVSGRTAGAKLVPLWNTAAFAIYDGTTTATSGVFAGSSTPVKAASTWTTGGNMVVYKSGTGGTPVGYTAGTVETSIGIGCNPDGSDNWFGTIRGVRLGQRALSASEAGAITA